MKTQIQDSKYYAILKIVGERFAMGASINELKKFVETVTKN